MLTVKGVRGEAWQDTRTPMRPVEQALSEPMNAYSRLVADSTREFMMAPPAVRGSRLQNTCRLSNLSIQRWRGRGKV